jgi:hypothetical protein
MRSKTRGNTPLPCKDTDPAIRTATEEILGMFVMAFGHGVPTGIHVRKEVVSAIRDALREGICRTVTKGWPAAWKVQWQRESNTVLNFMQSVGNLAARYAFADGERTILNADDFNTAFDHVRAEHKPHGYTNFGDWCPDFLMRPRKGATP